MAGEAVGCAEACETVLLPATAAVSDAGSCSFGGERSKGVAGAPGCQCAMCERVSISQNTYVTTRTHGKCSNLVVHR